MHRVAVHGFPVRKRFERVLERRAVGPFEKLQDTLINPRPKFKGAPAHSIQIPIRLFGYTIPPPIHLFLVMDEGPTKNRVVIPVFRIRRTQPFDDMIRNLACGVVKRAIHLIFHEIAQNRQIILLPKLLRPLVPKNIHGFDCRGTSKTIYC